MSKKSARSLAFRANDYVVYPAHGPARRTGRKLIEGALRHRARREKKLVAALEQGFERLLSLLPVVYDDAPPELHEAASRSLLAGLEKLAEEGRVVKRKGAWKLL